MALEAFTQFVAAINRHDVAAIVALMTEDRVFVDSRWNRLQGASSMQQGWSAYSAMCPDYWIRTGQVLAEGALVLAAGEAGGTIDGISWNIPAAWKAQVKAGRIAAWHVFADNQPVCDILARRQK